VPAPAIWPKRRFAVCGSKRSLAISQKPEAIRGPAPEIWRYTITAVTAGAVDLNSHSHRNSTPLTTNEAGTKVAAGIVFDHRPLSATSRIEHTEVAISMAGSAV
jgi:hypothetical protein